MRPPSGIRRSVVLASAAAVLVAGGLIVLLMSVRSSARHVLDRWVEIGLPAPAPSAEPPSFLWGWPPRLQWRNVAWNRPDRFSLTCDVLEVELRPIGWLLGRGGVASVQVRSLKLKAGDHWIPWCLSAFPTATMPAPRRPDAAPGMQWVGIRIDSLSVGARGARALHVSGWGGSARSGHWYALLHVCGPGPSTPGVELRLDGSGSAGIEELTAEALFAPGRSLSVTQRHPPGSPPTLRLTGRDDGEFLSLLIPGSSPAATPALSGTADLEVEWSPGAPPQGELRLLNVGSAAPGSAWRLSGMLCLADRLVTSQDLVLRSPEGELEFSIEQPAELDTPGVLTAQGRWGRREIEARAALAVSGGKILGVVYSLERNRALPAPIDLMLDLDRDRGGWGGVQASTRFDGGGLSLRWNAGSPLCLTADQVALQRIDPWLPADLPGRWSGRINGETWVDPLSDGAVAWGTAEMTGEVRGIRLLEEIETLREGREGSTGLAIDRLRARWSFARGEFLAESLAISVPSLQAEGSLYRSRADSLVGLLRVRPTSQSRWGSIFLLLGGDENRMDLGLGGTLRQPSVTPVGEAGRRALERRLRDLASRIAAGRRPSAP